MVFRLLGVRERRAATIVVHGFESYGMSYGHKDINVKYVTSPSQFPEFAECCVPPPSFCLLQLVSPASL